MAYRQLTRAVVEKLNSRFQLAAVLVVTCV